MEFVLAGTSRALFLSLLVGLLGCAPVTASTPTLLWQGATRVAVLCLVAPSRMMDRQTLQDDICRRVVANATRGAPLPVAEIAHGDPQVIAQDTVTLLVHASVDRGPNDGLLAAVSIRPFRATTDQTAQLFGAPPRAAPIQPDLRNGGALDAAIDAALTDILPWRQPPTPTGVQPLS